MGRIFRFPIPWMAAAFAAGLLSARPFGTISLVAIFPVIALALAAARTGRRLAASFLVFAAFAMAGSIRGASEGLPDSNAVDSPAPSSVPGDAGPSASGAGRPGSSRSGREPVPGRLAGPCSNALESLGLPVPTRDAPARLELEAWIAGAPAIGFETTRAEVEVARARPARERPLDPPPPWIDASGLRLLLSMNEGLRPLPGDAVRTVATLDELEPGLPGMEDARRRLDRAGIACPARVAGGQLGVMSPGGGIQTAVEVARRRISARVEEVMGPGPTAALLAALSVGDRSLVSPEQAERFAASGLSHLLSVSGLHLGLTVLGLYRILVWLFGRVGTRFDPRQIAALVALPAAPAYALLTGAQPPVVRAAVGAGLFLTAQIVDRSSEGWTALGAAALAILAWDPAALHEASFQLSFAACAGLLALSRGIRELIPVSQPRPDAPRWRRWLEVPLTSLATTAAATLATLPLTAFHFQRASVAALPANMIAVPVGLGATALCAVATAIGLVSRTAMAPVLWLAAPFAAVVDGAAAWFATWPGSRIPMEAPGIGGALAMCGASLALASLRRAPRRGLAALAVCLGILLLPWVSADPTEGKLVVDFLAVGQGDSTLLRLPDGSHILVDTGGELRGERDVAQRVLLPQLAERGVRSLDALALSHLHPDHVGSAPALLAAMPVGELWASGRPLDGRLGTPIADALVARGIPRRVLLQSSPPIERAGVRFEILGPPDRDGVGYEPLFHENDVSLVLRIVHGDVAILLPGDIEAEGEEALVASRADLRAQLIKAPHHGSSTSSSAALLERVRPHHVVFCVGRRNQFGFPRRDVVERYEARGCSLHRTDRGPVRFISDGNELKLAQ
ncbi:DNA internalization-related competence protein ComEC/Rec2 [Vulgatibacter incomptus]|uniref:DNA internalization-related competence protein ComEC/Rec2 n=1 Tax=Vulgatibacter incomptus TaxID=1391653 RepID=A0A0K1PCA4_9BACT|nr:DNA internalization-related competence protein ComEC/Rec2 [Vulgatibacter incomptus]AKU90729.1 DNA internalization-related competence protein ComEC/Rec2 [Vulgatibacter incomptus]